MGNAVLRNRLATDNKAGTNSVDGVKKTTRIFRSILKRGNGQTFAEKPNEVDEIGNEAFVKHGRVACDGWNEFSVFVELYVNRTDVSDHPTATRGPFKSDYRSSRIRRRNGYLNLNFFDYRRRITRSVNRYVFPQRRRLFRQTTID